MNRLRSGGVESASPVRRFLRLIHDWPRAWSSVREHDRGGAARQTSASMPTKWKSRAAGVPLPAARAKGCVMPCQPYRVRHPFPRSPARTLAR